MDFAPPARDQIARAVEREAPCRAHDDPAPDFGPIGRRRPIGRRNVAAAEGLFDALQPHDAITHPAGCHIAEASGPLSC